MISYKGYISTNEKQNLSFYRDMIFPTTKNENIDQQKNQTRETEHNIGKNKYDHTMNTNIT